MLCHDILLRLLVILLQLLDYLIAAPFPPEFSLFDVVLSIQFAQNVVVSCIRDYGIQFDISRVIGVGG
ncbi:hypothetical protein D3C73_1600840 [compost metagenome]